MTKQPKPCKKDLGCCVWCFSDWCLAFPGRKERLGGKGYVTIFRERQDISYKECEKIMVPVEDKLSQTRKRIMYSKALARREASSGSAAKHEEGAFFYGKD